MKDLTAEEFYEQSQHKGERYGNSIEIDETDLTELMEAYAKQKVLEALEEEVPKAYLSWYEGIDDLVGDKYYKTEVEPKYKK